MRLFGKVDGAVDRYDRAGWLTLPFDLAFTITEPNLSRLCVHRMKVGAALGGDVVVRATLGQARTTNRTALGVDEIETECC